MTDQPSPSAAARTEAVRQVAESSADAYVGGVAGILEGGSSVAVTRQAFVDGYLTAIETLLTMGERDAQPK